MRGDGSVHENHLGNKAHDAKKMTDHSLPISEKKRKPEFYYDLFFPPKSSSLAEK